MSWDESSLPKPPTVDSGRRSFLRHAAGLATGAVAFGAALSPLREMVDAKHGYSAKQFFQKHYKEMSREEMNEVLARVRMEVKENYGVDADISAPAPMDGVEFVYALNLSRCNGNRACVYACVRENNQSRVPEIQYIRVIEMPRTSLDLERGNHHYGDEKVPDKDHFYLPVQCHQCANAPCVKVCPVEATWQEPDGITVIDYDWCIGCRYCMAACPYWARRFNFSEPRLASLKELAANPDVEAERLNPEMSYLSNRPRPKGVVEKCHFCLHRTRKGKMPACLEACPTGARKFGNVLDPHSEVSEILKSKRIFVLKEDLGTLPRFFYYFDERTPQTDIPEWIEGQEEPA